MVWRQALHFKEHINQVYDPRHSKGMGGGGGGATLLQLLLALFFDMVLTKKDNIRAVRVFRDDFPMDCVCLMLE